MAKKVYTTDSQYTIAGAAPPLYTKQTDRQSKGSWKEKKEEKEGEQ